MSCESIFANVVITFEIASCPEVNIECSNLLATEAATPSAIRLISSSLTLLETEREGRSSLLPPNVIRLLAGGEASEAEDLPSALDEEGERILRIRGFSDDDTITASPDLCRF
jgi:hypothetical protein